MFAAAKLARRAEHRRCGLRRALALVERAFHEGLVRQIAPERCVLFSLRPLFSQPTKIMSLSSP